TAIVDCLYSPFMVLFAFLIVGERMGSWQLLGMVLVLAGVLSTTKIEPPPGMRTREMLMGIGWGALAMATMALGIVIAKPVLDRTPVLWATAMRQYGSLLVMIPIVLLSPQRRQILAVFRPAASWRFTLGGTLLGSVLALLCWIAGMKYTMVGTAAILNQTTTIHLLILAAIFLREPFTRRKAVAAVLALGGILLVILG
ncbi:MAG: DMT family transporter, partial [bacterium]